MAITAATRTQLIGLSVAMLGQAPGTDRLNHWVADIDDDAMSVEDLANHIAESEAFQSEYPAFLTSMEFAEAFLGSVLPGLDEASMTEAVDIVSGMLDSGTSRGALALAVVDFLHDVAMQGMDHDSYASFGMSAMVMANKIEVASHYTLNARMMDPSSDVLANVTADADSVMMAIEAIENPPSPPVDDSGDTFLLTALRDNVMGTAQDDDIFAEPALTATGGTVQSLQAYDSIDGGDGMDTLTVYEISDSLNIITDQVSNVEYVVINAQGTVKADMSDWDGLMSVELERFNGDIDITVDGAMVMIGETAGGSVDIDGAGGALSLATGRAPNEVNIVSRDHTTSVNVNGTADMITVDGNGRGGLSGSVDSVTASRFASLDVSSDALETLNISATFGAATVNYEGLQDLTLQVAAFGGKHDWVPSSPGLETREGMLTLTDENTDDESALESLTVEVSSNSKFALHSDVTNLMVTGTDSVNIQLDGNVDVSGKWVIEKEGEDDIEVGAQYVIMATDESGGYWKTVNGADDGDPVDAETTGAMEATAKPDGKEDAQDNWVTESIEMITVSGAAGLTVNASGQGDLTTVDLSESSGKNSVTLNATNKLTSVMGGSGSDTITVKTGNFASSGLMVDLGAGNDRFVTGAAKSLSAVAANSMINGGDGSDTLAMADGANSTDHTYREAGKTKTIYSGFETLDVGRGMGTYDLGVLGIENIQISKGTAAEVTLKNVKAGTAINASGNSSAGDMTKATVNYQVAEREGGSFDFGATSLVGINATAAGRYNDKGDNPATRGVYDPTINGASNVTMVLTIDDDQDIQGLMIDSSANAGGTALSSDYHNVFCVNATDVINVKITGNAKATFKSINDDQNARVETALDAIEYVDATENTAGVIVHVEDGAGRTQSNGSKLVTLLGSHAADEFHGSQEDGVIVINVLQGNGGNDMLNGGNATDIFVGGAGADVMNGGSATGGADQFRYYAASSSQVTFLGEAAIGFDRIMNFESGDAIRLSSSLLANSNNDRKTSSIIDSTDNDVQLANDGDPATSPTANNLRLLIGDGDGFFLTRAGLEFTKNFVAVVSDNFHRAVGENETANFDSDGDDDPDRIEDNRTWVLIDIDGDGNFDAANDMVIQLSGIVESENIVVGVIS